MRTEHSERWVRGYAGHTLVADTRRPLLFWEDGFPVPGYAVPDADVRLDLLTPAPPPARWHPFFGPHGPVSEVWDLVADGSTLRAVAWRRDDPALAGHVVLSWLPDGGLRWTEEDEPVVAHPRDPHKRVDALPSSRHVVVSVGGTVVGDTHHPVLLFETGVPTRHYLPPEDVRLDLLTEVAHSTVCPYKGTADRYWSLPGLERIAWSYSEPVPAAAAVGGRIAFYDEFVDTTVDGVERPRPRSPFSAGRP